MFAKIRIIIENTSRSMAMPDGTATFATDFSLMIGLNIIANGGRQIHTSPRGYSCLRNWKFLLLHRPVNRLYIF